MADEIDKANDEIEARLKFTLKTVDTSVENNNSGKCIWCEKKIEDKRRWCSVYCRDEHTLYANKW